MACMNTSEECGSKCCLLCDEWNCGGCMERDSHVFAICCPNYVSEDGSVCTPEDLKLEEEIMSSEGW